MVKSITKDFVEPAFGDNDTWSDSTIKEYEANVKASYTLMQELNDDDLAQVINCTLAYNMWRCLITTHEGTSQVNKQKLIYLSQYDRFYMLNGESITAITNGLVSLGKLISNDQKVGKILRAFPKSWEVKITTLKELNDKEKNGLHHFHGKLEDQCNGDEGKKRSWAI